MISEFTINRETADHVAATLPIQTLATLTHAGRQVSTEEHNATFDAFTRRLQADTRLTVGYIRGVEGPVPHSHVAIIAAKPIAPSTVENAWKTVSGVSGALADKFDPAKGDGIGYLLKDGNSQFSDNAHLFSSTTSAETLSGQERRTFKRIQEQRSQTQRPVDAHLNDKATQVAPASRTHATPTVIKPALSSTSMIIAVNKPSHTGKGEGC